jgi:hypothetical protein
LLHGLTASFHLQATETGIVLQKLWKRWFRKKNGRRLVALISRYGHAPIHQILRLRFIASEALSTDD